MTRGTCRRERYPLRRRRRWRIIVCVNAIRKSRRSFVIPRSRVRPLRKWTHDTRAYFTPFSEKRLPAGVARDGTEEKEEEKEELPIAGRFASTVKVDPARSRVHYRRFCLAVSLGFAGPRGNDNAPPRNLSTGAFVELRNRARYNAVLLPPSSCLFHSLPILARKPRVRCTLPIDRSIGWLLDRSMDRQ